MNKEGAISGMICGILFTMSYIVYFQFMGGTKDQYLFGISPEGIGFLGMLVNFTVAFVVASFTKAPPKEVTDLIDKVRYPGGEETAAAEH
jgi:cation/acetate symporter